VNRCQFLLYHLSEEVKNLYVLTRGVVPPNPSELLSSKRFEVILKKLQKIFDYIILDSVPTNGLPDALVLSKLVDKTLIVCKYGYTDITDLESTKKALENVNANIAGVVINKVPKTRSKYGNYYYAE
jgi:capsular exopolysaccharide synthesis family protein